MKPHTEMREGPEATKRFEETMKTLFSARKPDTSGDSRKADKTTTKKVRSKPKH